MITRDSQSGESVRFPALAAARVPAMIMSRTTVASPMDESYNRARDWPRHRGI